MINKDFYIDRTTNQIISEYKIKGNFHLVYDLQ